MIYEQIGGVLRSYRKRNRLSMQEVGDRLGVTKVCVHHWETGTRRIGIDLLRAYCEVLNIPVQEALSYTGIDEEELEMMSEDKTERTEWQILVSYEDGTEAFVTCECMNDALAYFHRMEVAGLFEGADHILILNGKEEIEQ